MRKLFWFVIFLSLMLAGCQENKINNSNIRSIKVNYNDAITIIDTSLIDINSIEYIPLISKEGVIGEVSQLLVVDKHFFILDKQQKCVWEFDSKGVFQRKLSRHGKGPGEYTGIERISISEEKTLHVMGTVETIPKYDVRDGFPYKGNFYSSQAPIDILCTDTLVFVLYRYVPQELKDTSYYIEVFNQRNGHRKGFFPYLSAITEGFGDDFFIKCTDSIYIRMPHNDTIYKVIDHLEVAPSYYFDFGKDKFPNEQLLRCNSIEEKEALLKDKIHHGKISHFRMSESHIAFLYSQVQGNSAQNSYFVYNRLTDESANYNGLMWQGLSSDFNHPLATDGEFFYSVLYPYHFSEKGKKDLKGRGVTIDDTVYLLKFKYKI